MILEIFKNSFEYGFKNKKILLKLGILAIFSFLIIPLILILGYNYKIIKIGLNGMMEGFDPIPELKNIKEMFIQGLKILIVIVAYSIIPLLILTFLLNTTVINTFEFIDPSNFNIQLDIGFISILLIAILFLLSFLMTIVAIPHMIKNNSLKYGSKIKDILKIIRYVGIIQYIKFYIAIIILIFISPILTFIISQIIVSVINGLITIITGINIGILLLNYLNIAIFTLIFFLFNIPFITIAINRAISFMYNDDIIKNQD